MEPFPDTIIPAAGASSRMGRWKPGLPWRGGWVIDPVVAAARSSGSRVIIVSHNHLLEDRFAHENGVTVVRNTQPELGMFSSIQRGVREVRTGWCFVLPADMPMIPGWIFALLLETAGHAVGGRAPTAGANTAGAPERVVRPVFHGSPGHPVLLPPAVLQRVLEMPSGSTMRDALQGVPQVNLPVNDRGVCIDLDTEQDYQRIVDNRSRPR